MAASNTNRGAGAPASRAPRWLDAAALQERLAEEVSRAERHGAGLGCLLVVVENLDGLAERYGSELGEQAPRYIAAALEPGLRRFDAIGRPSAHELLIVLPGAGGARAELVARRALERLRTIKVEAHGVRIPLRIAVGLAGWQDGAQPADLLQSARLAARGGETGTLEGESPATRS